MLSSEVKEVVPAVHVEETKCSQENNTSVTNISSERNMQFLLLLMVCFDVWLCRR